MAIIFNYCLLDIGSHLKIWTPWKIKNENFELSLKRCLENDAGKGLNIFVGEWVS